MSKFFLAVELFSYAFALFLLFKKQELAIIYLPVIVFANNIIVNAIPASVYYLTLSTLILSLLLKNATYYKYNGFSIILTLYIIALIPRSDDIVFIRPALFAVLWLLTVIPLITSIYKKYSREIIFAELSKSALIILLLFTVNVLVSSLKGYSPFEMYGITKGILYGKVYAAGFNVLPIAVFVIALKFIEDRKIFPFAVLIVSITFLMLSFRRSVMLLSLMGIGFAYLSLLTREKVKMFFLIGTLTVMAGFIIYNTTNLADHFKERYELRKLDDRELEEEQRFIEYELLYKDMFVYRDYSPIIGYELFNSWGNYGRGIFEERSLHSDLTNIAHSSGLLGVLLYLLMVFTAFRNALKGSTSRKDILIILFCAFAFIGYTITGRYTEIASSIMLYLVLALPSAKEKEDIGKKEEIEEKKPVRKNQYFSLPNASNTKVLS